MVDFFWRRILYPAVCDVDEDRPYTNYSKCRPPTLVMWTEKGDVSEKSIYENIIGIYHQTHAIGSAREKALIPDLYKSGRDGFRCPHKVRHLYGESLNREVGRKLMVKWHRKSKISTKSLWHLRREPNHSISII